MNAPAPQRMTYADTVLINALAWLIMEIQKDRNEAQMFLDTLREALPHCSDNNPQMVPLITAAKLYLAFPLGADAPKELASATLRARYPVLTFLKRRCALALDAMRAAQNEDVS